MNAAMTATIIEVTNPEAHCPEHHVCGEATLYLSGFAAYRLALEGKVISCHMPAAEVEVMVGSYRWASAESHDYSLRGAKPPHNIARILQEHSKEITLT